MKQKMSRSDQALSKYLEVPNLPSNSVEGTDYIILDKTSNSALGRLLGYSHSSKIKTFLGTARSVRAFMDFIITPNYPLELLSKMKLTKEDFDSIPRKKIDISNYWALCAYVVCERVRQDKSLIELIKKNTLPITFDTVAEKRVLWGKEITVYSRNRRTQKYTAIVRYVVDLVQNGKLTDDEINAFIENCKDNPDKDILEGVILPPNIIVSELSTDKTTKK